MSFMYKAFLFVAYIFLTISALEIMFIAPAVTKSQLLFSRRFANVLRADGHSVTYVAAYLGSHASSASIVPENMTEIIHMYPEAPEWVAYNAEMGKKWSKYVFGEPDLYFYMAVAHPFDVQCYFTCKKLLEQMEKFQARKFDLVLSNYIVVCSLGVAKLLDVPLGWISPGNYILDSIAEKLHIPYPTSYVPTVMSENGDYMNFAQRLEHFVIECIGIVGTAANMYIEPRLEHNLFSDFNIHQLGDLAQTFLINGDALLDFPRPLINRMLYVGELEQIGYKQPLTDEWQTIVNAGKRGFILFSLGSGSYNDLMPQEWVVALTEVFALLPEYQIIWKFEDNTTNIVMPRNVHTANWLPQRELLGHPRLKVFMTHGGYNSLLEASQAGVPLLLFPLFYDQAGNAKRAERLGFGLSVTKSNFSKATVFESLQKILTDDRYGKNAKSVSSMLNDRVVSTQNEMLHRIRKLGKNIDPHFHYDLITAGRLNFLQYYLIDFAIFVCIVHACSCMLF